MGASSGRRQERGFVLGRRKHRTGEGQQGDVAARGGGGGGGSEWDSGVLSVVCAG